MRGVDLRVDELELSGCQRWGAVVAMVEGIEGESLEVVPMCFYSHGSHFVESGYNLVTGMVEHPLSEASLATFFQNAPDIREVTHLICSVQAHRSHA